METVSCLHYEWNNKVVMALDISTSQAQPHSTEGRSIKFP